LERGNVGKRLWIMMMIDGRWMMIVKEKLIRSD